jgi:hypothetical protein
MGHEYFKEPQSLLATREGEVCMKDDDHHMRHPRARTRISFGAGGENLDEAGEEGRNYVLQLRLHHLLLLVNLISLGKTRK